MARPTIYKNADILRVAMRVFLEDGLSASTKRIAELAGVSEAILFKRFKTKEALFEAAMKMEIADDSWGRNLVAQVGRGTPYGNLVEALTSLLERLQVIIPKIMILRAAGRLSSSKQILKTAPPIRDARAIRAYLVGEQKLGRLHVHKPLLHAHQMVGSIAHYVTIKEMSGSDLGSSRDYINTLVESQLAIMPPQIRKLTRRSTMVVSLSIGFFLLFTSFAFSEPITWKQCVNEAALNNPGIAAAMKEIERTEAVRKGAFSSYLPHVTLSAGFARSKGESAVGTGNGVVEVTTFGDSGFWTNYADSYTAQLEIQQTLFDGFATKGNVDKARAEIHIAIAKLLTQKSGTSYELKSAFAQLLYSQQLIGVLSEIIEQRARNFRMVELKYENGRENKGSLLLSKAQLSQAKLDLTQAHRLLDLSRIQLSTVMGRQKYSALDAKGSLSPSTPAMSPDFQKLALATPATFQQAAATDAAKAGITIAQSDFYPQINAFANLSTQNNSRFDKPTAWSFGVNGSLAIFDGSQTYFNVRSARIAHESSIITLRQSVDDAAQSLAEAFRIFCDAVDQISVGQELYEAAALRAQIVEAQYRNGLASFQDFDLITNDKIARQKSDLMNRRDAILAEAAWEQALGVGAIP